MAPHSLGIGHTLTLTPIVRDMQTTARELGITDLVGIAYRQLRDRQIPEAVLLLEVLARLGGSKVDTLTPEEEDAIEQEIERAEQRGD